MGDFNFGMQAASQATGGILGLVMSGINDQRQLDQQRALQSLQIQGNKEMMDYSMMKQMQMWEATNYNAQKAQMKKAGLNPGLMYGMSGGSGTTTGSPNGSVNGANAPVGGGEQMQGIGMALQMGLMDAQRKVLDSQANLNNVEANKKAGVDTQVGEATAASLTQGVNESKAREALTKVQTGIAEIQKEFDSESKEDRKSLIYWEYRKALDTTQSISLSNEITSATKQTKIDIITQEYQKLLVENELIQAQTNLSREQAKKVAAEVQQGWRALDINQQNANTQQAQQKLNAWVNDVSEKTKLTVQTVKDIGEALLNKLIPSKHIVGK